MSLCIDLAVAHRYHKNASLVLARLRTPYWGVKPILLTLCQTTVLQLDIPCDTGTLPATYSVRFWRQHAWNGDETHIAIGCQRFTLSTWRSHGNITRIVNQHYPRSTKRTTIGRFWCRRNAVLRRIAPEIITRCALAALHLSADRSADDLTYTYAYYNHPLIRAILFTPSLHV